MLIGLSVNHKDGLSCISNAYVNAVIKAGGSPVLIPFTNNETVLKEIISQIDGLILSGGGDIYAPLFNEPLHPAVESYDIDRDNYDIQLVKLAVDRQIPILGICRGQQVINVALGGNLIQDIPSHLQLYLPDGTLPKVNHNQAEARETGTHSIQIKPGSKLCKIIGSNKISVNSFHHQSVHVVAPGLEAVAYSEDGIIEAIESTEEKAILGVQWHPENMAVAGNEAMIDTFRYLASEAEIYKQAKEIHKQIHTLDSHCDTPMHFHKGIDIGKKTKGLQVDLIKMQEGMLDGTIMVAYLKQGARDEASLRKAIDKAKSIISQIREQVESNKNIAGIAYTSEDLKKNKSELKKSVFVGIENGYAIGKDIHNLAMFKDMGVVYITLCHNGDNDICDSAIGQKEHNGLSSFGKDVVKEMNRLGIMIDISHTSEKTSFDVLKISEYPVIASHSSAKALCNHPRNLSDKLIEAIADKGGVVQICFYTHFLTKGSRATVKDAVDHIEYVIRLVGIDHVGIGSDFDGGGGIIGVKAVNEFPQITMELIRRGYSQEDIAKIWGGNLMRVMDTVQSKSK